jgi:hypothetical protein
MKNVALPVFSPTLRSDRYPSSGGLHALRCCRRMIGDRFADSVFLNSGIDLIAVCSLRAIGYGFAGICDAVGPLI